jgi:hypothetical protein
MRFRNHEKVKVTSLKFLRKQWELQKSNLLKLDRYLKLKAINIPEDLPKITQ